MKTQTNVNQCMENMHEVHAQEQFKALFPPLEQVTKPNLTTGELAYYLNRRPQTLRGWACKENGLMRPKRIGGLLAWPVSELKRVLGVTA